MAVSYDKNNQTSGLNSAERLNAELTKIQTALQDAVSRSGNAPNAMSADLDLGGNDLLNVDTVHCSELLVDGAPVPSIENIIEAFEDGQAALDDSIAQAQQDLNDAVVEATNDLNNAVAQAESDLNSAVSSAESTIQGYVNTAQSAAAAASSHATDAENARVAAVAAQEAAEDARDEAADLVASVELPEISAADAGKVLSVSSAGQYEVALVLKDEIAKAVAQLTRWAPFDMVGSAGTSTMTDIVAVDALDTARVVAYSATTGELRTLEFDGSTWSEVASGSGFGIALSGRIKAATSDRALVVRNTLAGNALQMYLELSGGTWTPTGSPGTITSDTGFADVATLNSTTAVTVAADGFLRAHLYNSPSWSIAHSLAITNEGSRPLIISFPDNRVIVYLRNSGQFACYEWTGSILRHVSTSTNFGWNSGSAGGAVVAMCPLGRMDFVVSRDADRARVVRFDGHNWYTVDAPPYPLIVGADGLFTMNDHVIGSLSSDQVQAFSTQLTLGRPNTPISGDWT